MKVNKEISVNQLNGEEYELPLNLDDSSNIDEFLNRNKHKKVVVVQGLGFVGAVMSLVCANSGNDEYAVIGVDLLNVNTYWKIKSINEGFFPINASDPKIKEFYENTQKRGNFYATYDPYAYSKADVIIVDINLDVKKNNTKTGKLLDFQVDISSFEKAISVIGKNCMPDALILIETTVPPGTTKNIAYPIIKKGLNQRGLTTKNFKLGHSYERVMPGPDYIDSIKNFYRVFSGIDEKSEIATEKFLKTIISTEKYPLTKLGNTNATELAKVLENSFRAMNIAFVVEWSRFAEISEINLYEVIEAIRMRPTHKNLMMPGIGVGGYCLTKDPLLASWSKTNIFSSKGALNQSIEGVNINDQMPLYAYNFLKSNLDFNNLDKRNVLILGISYRSNVADTRYSPVENFYNYIIDDGAKVSLHDPYVKYWEEKKIHINDDLFMLLKNKIDVLVFTTAHDEYRNNKKLIECILQKDKMQIFDTVGILSESDINLIKIRHKLRIIGRGDIN